MKTTLKNLSRGALVALLASAATTARAQQTPADPLLKNYADAIGSTQDTLDAKKKVAAFEDAFVGDLEKLGFAPVTGTYDLWLKVGDGCGKTPAVVTEAEARCVLLKVDSSRFQPELEMSGFIDGAIVADPNDDGNHPAVLLTSQSIDDFRTKSANLKDVQTIISGLKARVGDAPKPPKNA